MSTLNNVFKKLDSIDKVNQVNLASQKVELGVIQDLEKEYTKIVNSTKAIISEGTRIDKEIFNYRDTYAVDAVKFIDLKANYTKMAKELGVDVDGKFDKALNDLSEAKNTFKGLIGR